jgi:hypothetical protein
LVSISARALSVDGAASSGVNFAMPALLISRSTSWQRRRRCHLLGIGNVEQDRIFNARAELRGLARGGVDLFAAGLAQKPREGQAEAAIGAGDQRRRSTDVHASSLAAGLIRSFAIRKDTASGDGAQRRKSGM